MFFGGVDWDRLGVLFFGWYLYVGGWVVSSPQQLLNRMLLSPKEVNEKLPKAPGLEEAKNDV